MTFEDPVTIQEGTGMIVDAETNMYEGNQVNGEPVVAANDPGTQAGEEVINDTTAAGQQNYIEPQVAGGVDPMLRDQSGYDAGFANGEGDGSAKYEPGNEIVDGVRNDYIGGYIRGFEEARAPQPGEYVDNGPPQGPDNGPGPVEPNTESADPDYYNQTGGDGYRLGVDAEMVGGQPVVEGYDSEQTVCSDNQVGGGSPFNFITDPDTNASLSIFSDAGKALLKRYVKAYKQMQSGGAALLEGVEPNATGALYDGIEGAGAENMPDACGLTYDAAGPNWVHTQVGGAKHNNKKRNSKKCKCELKYKKCKKCEKHGCRGGKQCDC